MADARAAQLQKNVKVCAPGDLIFSEGEIGEVMYVILEGEVEILKNAQAGATRVLTTLGKGEYFGEMALIDSSFRSASAKAKVRTMLLVMNEAVFDSYILSNPEFAQKMIRNLTKRLRGANKLIEQALAGNTVKAVQEGLIQFAKEKGFPTVKGLRVSIPAFADWASSHLAVPEKNVPDILRTLVERGIIVTSALGENEVIYPQK